MWIIFRILILCSLHPAILTGIGLQASLDYPLLPYSQIYFLLGNCKVLSSGKNLYRSTHVWDINYHTDILL
jgi:hypothetical protein